MPKLQIQVQEDVLQRIDDVAAGQGCGTDKIVSDALGRYLQWHEQQMLLWQETEEAMEQADRGEVTGAEEVFSWLDTWGESERMTG